MDYAMTDEEFQRFRRLVYQESGIALSANKKALLVSRLSKRLRELGLKTFRAYYKRVVEGDGRSPLEDKEFTHMLDLISTNKTDFFREPKHFEFMHNHLLPEHQETKNVRIWSAGCSSGEEPYSIAITLYDGMIFPAQRDCKILASDLSTRVLTKAASGIYEIERVKNLTPEVIRRHFANGIGVNIGKVKVKPHLSSMIVFQRINLMDERYPIKTPLDVIFCRNVMIYFDRPTQERLIHRFYNHLKPGGHLFIGHSESIQWIEHQFVYVEPTIYQKRA